MKSAISPDRSTLLPGTLVIYTLLIAYASLSPFIGWRAPENGVLHFLTVWPRYITRHDVFINILAYIPLGWLAALTLYRRRKDDTTIVPIVIATTVGAVLSLSMETLQVFIPGRVAELTDLLTNTAGGLVGAILAQPCWQLFYRKN